MVNIELDPHGKKSFTETSAELEKTFETLSTYVCDQLCMYLKEAFESEDKDEALDRLDRERCRDCPIQLLY